MSSTDRLYQYLTQVAADKGLEQADVAEIEQELGALIKLRGTVSYINSYTKGEILFHSGFNSVLGYPESTKIDQQFILDIIHPDDQPIAHYLIHMASELHMDFRTDVQPYATMFEINYRVRKHDGSYLMMLKRSTGFMNEQISSGANLSTLQDVSFMNLPNTIKSKVSGFQELEAKYDAFLNEIQYRHASAGPFSKREIEVLLYLARGFQSTQIAEKLFLSKHTVNNHRKNMLRKTGLKNSAELVRFGLENGLL